MGSYKTICSQAGNEPVFFVLFFLHHGSNLSKQLIGSYETPCFRGENEPAFSLHHGSNLTKQLIDYVII